MIGTTISHYKIFEKLGEGGMGVVYKAQDTKLNRTVALKFLPEHVSTPESDTARFMQEAQAAASLNHPNICTIHGIEEADGKHFIVMEFVDGQMLQEKKSSLSIKQAIDIGIQIAEGLAAAHEKGIVHRDIKPENIMIRKDGRVQVMDFGLAKLRGASRLTKEGSTVGTAGYMSPEQVQGQETDHRSDIFSLGVLLYEMLAGQSPFKGVHETAIVYEIVNVDPPPPSSVKPDISPELDGIILECLEKDKEERCQSAKELAKNLRKTKRSTGNRTSRIYRAYISTPENEHIRATSGILDAAFKRSLSENRVFLTITAVLLLALLITTSLWLNSSPRPSTRSMHLSIVMKEGLALGAFSSFAISPDGSKILYTVDQPNARMLYIREIDSYDAKPIPGTEGALSPCFSSDGKWLAFWSNDVIRKVLVAGGPVIEVYKSEVPTHTLPYLFWGTDHEMYFSLGEAGGVYRLSEDGGHPEPIAETDSQQGQISYRWPVLLPGRKNLMFTAQSGNENERSSVMVKSLETGSVRTIVDHAGYAQYMDPGYIVFMRDHVLFASRFDIDDLSLSGSLIPVLPEVTSIPQTGQAEFSFSDNGTLIYLSGSAPTNTKDLIWRDRSGAIRKTTDLHQPIEDFHVSPDGKKVAVTIEGAVWNIWIYDIQRNTLTRMTYGADNRDPLWAPDGKSIVYGSFRDGYYGLFLAPVDDEGKETRLTTSKYFEGAFSFSPDGKYVAYGQADSLNSIYIAVKDVKSDAEPEVVARAPFVQWYPAFSQNGRYIAYQSLESGRYEIYAIPFKGPGSKIQISTNGGETPFWSNDGNALFYFQGNQLMEVPVDFKSGLMAGSPKELFSGDIWTHTIRPGQQIPGTKTFMMMKPEQLGDSRNSLNIILHWKEELEKKLANAN